MFQRAITNGCLISLLLLSASCTDDDPVSSSKKDIVGSGEWTTVERTLPTFNSISMEAVGNVFLKPGSEQAVSISVNDNILQYIQTTVSDGVLTIKSDPTVNLIDYDLGLIITMTDIEDLSLIGVGIIHNIEFFYVDDVNLLLSGVGNIYVRLETTHLSSTLVGVGDIILRGTAVTHDCVHSGVGHIRAFDIPTDSSVIRSSGVGNIDVDVIDYLDVNISGTGSVYYQGTPTVEATITGSGRLIPMD